MYCTNCGAQVPAEAMFCSGCGRATTQASAVATPPRSIAAAPPSFAADLNSLKASVAEASSLDDRQLAIYNAELQRREKSLLVAYLLWFFLGGIGAYRFYLGDAKMGWTILALVVGGALTLSFYIGAIPLIIGAIIVLVDAFRMPGIVRGENERLGHNLAAMLRK